jgi:hypothetical protein
MEIKIVLPLEKVKTMIQKSELQQVPVEQRVPGMIYGASDDLEGTIHFMVLFGWESKDSMGTKWKYWFALPESMLPVREVSNHPDHIRLDLNEWSYSYSDSHILLHRKKTRPELTIPSGTKQEQIEALESLLNELKK